MHLHEFKFSLQKANVCCREAGCRYYDLIVTSASQELNNFLNESLINQRESGLLLIMNQILPVIQVCKLGITLVYFRIRIIVT
jgi:hypothetical protein